MIKLREHWRTCRCAAALLAAATYPVAASTPAAQSSPAPQDIAVIYVARRGWHVDIGFSAADLRPPLKSVLDEFPGAQYLFFGFGDRRYLLARHRNAPVLLAALWPGRGMILATGLTSPPAAAFGAPHVVALAVTARQASDAQDFVWHSLDTASGSHPQAADKPVKSYAAGPYEGSLLFTAVPKYSALYTCNTWVAEALAAAALPIHSKGVIFAGQLWKRVLRLEKQPSVLVRPTASLSLSVKHRSAGHRPAAQAVVLGRPTAMRWRKTTEPSLYSIGHRAALDLRPRDRRVEFRHGTKFHRSPTVQGPRGGLESCRAIRGAHARTNT